VLQRVPLIIAPTPLHKLERLSGDLGLDLWIKRDDLTGFAFGGNKGRKIEYLVTEALAAKAEVVVTCGSLQSNFIRQLGAACAMYGLRCVAVVMETTYDKPAGKPKGIKPIHGGNETLDEILGVDLRLQPDNDWDVLFELWEETARELDAAGQRVYRIPVGGSSPVGAYAFYQAGQELMIQAPNPFDWIVFATSSGSTQTGLAYAFNGHSTQVLGIACDPEPEIAHDFAEVGKGLAELLSMKTPLSPEDYKIDFGSVGGGYGVRSPEGDAAIQLMARREGIFLDPIYSGKAFAGLMRLAQEGKIGGRVLFWHTGGTPALFAS
jgi:1-aminocyclopropane-1-carboxylate deaminase/D-cysteine desulfhydrase-like pyridoxal-dependent ACC family enzyme